jgi:hypothetical protein
MPEITEGKLSRGIKHHRIVEPLHNRAARDIIERCARIADQSLVKLSVSTVTVKNRGVTSSKVGQSDVYRPTETIAETVAITRR